MWIRYSDRYIWRRLAFSHVTILFISMQILSQSRHLTYQYKISWSIFTHSTSFSEKQQLVVVGECGDSMAAVQGLLKKHEALEAELAARGDRVADITAEGRRLVDGGNLHAEALAHRLHTLQVRINIHVTKTTQFKNVCCVVMCSVCCLVPYFFSFYICDI